MIETRDQERRENGNRPPRADVSGLEVLDQRAFVRMLRAERKRNERSERRFVLMLLECAGAPNIPKDATVFRKVIDQLVHRTRETDVKGWYKEQAVFGVIFTEVDQRDGSAVVSALLARVSGLISSALSIEEISRIRISFHVFPDDLSGDPSDGPPDLTLYLDETLAAGKRQWSLVSKRLMDVSLSLSILACIFPVMLLIALAIKLTSPGPVLFKQQRLGRFGRTFTFLKFRSMQVANDDSIHHAFVERLINGSLAENGKHEPNRVYKLTNDPRVTPIGRFLRKTSLDELPQFWNVLRGEMSIVGPRPPIPYEYARYRTWHRRRLLSVKPGITGLWQVRGRSRVKFDDMVRLDLHYSETWSIWLDVTILLKTPLAVVLGSGAH